MISITCGQNEHTFEGVQSRKQVQTIVLEKFGLKEGEFTLTYKDAQQDQIALQTQEDFETLKVLKLQYKDFNPNIIVTPTVDSMKEIQKIQKIISVMPQEPKRQQKTAQSKEKLQKELLKQNMLKQKKQKQQQKSKQKAEKQQQKARKLAQKAAKQAEREAEKARKLAQKIVKQNAKVAKQSEKQKQAKKEKRESQKKQIKPNSDKIQNNIISEVELEKRIEKKIKEMIPFIRNELKESQVTQLKNQKIIQQKQTKQKCTECDKSLHIELNAYYKCIVCKGFIICQKCETKHNNSHPLLKIKPNGEEIFLVLNVLKSEIKTADIQSEEAIKQSKSIMLQKLQNQIKQKIVQVKNKQKKLKQIQRLNKENKQKKIKTTKVQDKPVEVIYNQKVIEISNKIQLITKKDAKTFYKAVQQLMKTQNNEQTIIEKISLNSVEL